MALTTKKLSPLDILPVIGPKTGYTQAKTPPLKVVTAPSGINYQTPVKMVGTPGPNANAGPTNPYQPVFQQNTAPKNFWDYAGNIGAGVGNSIFDTMRLAPTALGYGASFLPFMADERRREFQRQQMAGQWESSIPGQAYNTGANTAMALGTMGAAGVAGIQGREDLVTAAAEQQREYLSKIPGVGDAYKMAVIAGASKANADLTKKGVDPKVVAQATNDITRKAGIDINDQSSMQQVVGAGLGAALLPAGIAGAPALLNPVKAAVSMKNTPKVKAEAPKAPITNATIKNETPFAEKVDVRVSESPSERFRLQINDGARKIVKDKSLRKEVTQSALETKSGDAVAILMDVMAKSPNKGKIRTVIEGLGVSLEGNAKNRLIKTLVKTTEPKEVSRLIHKAVTEAPVTKASIARKPKAGDPKTTAFKQGEKLPAEAQALVDKVFTKSGKPRVRQKLASTAKQPTTKPVLDETRGTTPKVKKKKKTPETQGQIVETSINPADPLNNNSKPSSVKNVLKKAYESDAPMLDMFRKIDKETGSTHKGLSFEDQYYLDTGDIKMATQIANSRIARDENLQSMLGDLQGKDMDKFKEYLKAKGESSKSYEGKSTYFTPEERTAILTDGDDYFKENFANYQAFTKKMATEAYENGRIDKKTHEAWMKTDDYVRIQRDMEDLVNNGAMTSSGSRSFASTKVKQKRRGSKRDILDPINALMRRAQEETLENIRNRTADNTINMLESVGLAKRTNNATAKNTVSRFRNGTKEYWEVPRDIKEAMEGVKPQMAGTAAQIMSIIATPVRLIRAGATGLDPSFAARNMARDQSASLIQSENAMATHHPKNIIKGLGSAARDFGDKSSHPLWKEFEKHASNNTRFDDLQLRGTRQTNAVIRELQQGRKGRLKNRVLAPIKTLEDFVAISERSTRFQNFIGEFDRVYKETGDRDLAIKKADLAARKNTTDFSRTGDFTQVASLLYPFFNASIQGTRSMARSFRKRPVATSFKALTSVTLPAVALTVYNYADEDRRKAYESIKPYEKMDNYIVVLPGAHQDSRGTWHGLIKIPKPQGYRELADPMVAVAESFFNGKAPADAARILKDVVGALAGPIETSSGDGFLGSLVPQAVKPYVQAKTNTNLYTGSKIVPEFMLQETDDPTKRAYEDTSGSARIIAEHFGISPITVEQFIKDTGASMAMYGLNAVDQAAAKAGMIPDDQIGGKTVLDSFKKGFTEASGEVLEENKTDGRKFFEKQATVIKESKLNANELAAFQSLHPKKANFLGEAMYEADSTYNAVSKLDIYNRFPKVFEVDRRMNQWQAKNGGTSNPVFDLTPAQRKKVLEKEALPPGAKDPELSNLYKEDWYAKYSAGKSKYFDKIASNVKADLAKATKEGDTERVTALTESNKKFANPKNPYPETSPELQKQMDAYSALESGTGAKSAWIKANPDAWAKMTAQWEAVDNWQNKARAKRGLAATEGKEGEKNGFKESSGSSYSKYSKSSKRSRSGGGKGSGINEYGYLVNRNSGNISLKQPSMSSPTVNIKSKKTSAGKPKVTLKKAKA